MRISPVAAIEPEKRDSKRNAPKQIKKKFFYPVWCSEARVDKMEYTGPPPANLLEEETKEEDTSEVFSPLLADDIEFSDLSELPETSELKRSITF